MMDTFGLGRDLLRTGGVGRILRRVLLLRKVPAKSVVLDIGCGERWAGEFLEARGIAKYVGVDAHSQHADVQCDIRLWSRSGGGVGAFDVVLAFEVLEHVWCRDELYDLVRPGGLLLATSPIKRWDWVCRALEHAGVFQRRTSEHCVDARMNWSGNFSVVTRWRPLWIMEWVVLRRHERVHVLEERDATEGGQPCIAAG